MIAAMPTTEIHDLLFCYYCRPGAVYNRTLLADGEELRVKRQRHFAEWNPTLPLRCAHKVSCRTQVVKSGGIVVVHEKTIICRGRNERVEQGSTIRYNSE